MTDRDIIEIEEIRATIAKLNAETMKLLAETTKMQGEAVHQPDTIAKLNAETAKLLGETRFPPVIIAAAMISLTGFVAQIAMAIYGN